MDNKIAKVRFAKCPKCLQILTEFEGVPVYRCGGCGAILRAKPHACSEQKLSTDSTNSGSQKQSGTAALNDASTGLQTSGSDISGVIEEGDAIKNVRISNSKSEICKGKVKPSGLLCWDEDVQRFSGQFTNEREEMHQVQESRLEKGNGSLNSSDKLEDSVTTASEEDMINVEFQSGACFMKNIRSLNAYDGSISSTDENGKGDIHRNFLRLSRRTFRNKKPSNSFGREKEGDRFSRKYSNERLPSSCNGELSCRNVFQAEEGDASFLSEDFHSLGSWMHSESEVNAKQESKLRFSKEDEEDQVNILRKVDELRDELSELFNKTVKNQFRGKANHFHGINFHQKHTLPHLFLSSANSNLSISIPPGGQCCHKGSCYRCPHNIACHLSHATRLDRHIGTCSCLHQAQQNLQSKDSKPPPMLRHCRPVSGGAPFAICKKCFELLQLPADFLVFARRVHRIRCGACSQVLEYHFKPKSRSALRVSPEFHLPPRQNSEANVVDSCETEASVYNEWIRCEEEEVDVFGQVTGLRLHQLMGYASASELLFQTGGSDCGYESTATASGEGDKWRNG